MLILGIAGLFHDAAAALVRDGELIAFAEEERFIREKHAHGKMPYNAIRFCLDRAGVQLREIDHLAYYFDVERGLMHDWSVETFFSHFRRCPRDLVGYLENLQMIRASIEAFADASRVPLTVLDHHDCHLASAFLLSPFERANVISLDARGEIVTAVVARGDGASLTRLREVPMPHSIGMLYTAVTQFLGFSPFDGEGTVMGLASFGEDRHAAEFDRIVRPTPDGFVTRPELYWSHATVGWLSAVPNGLIGLFGEPRPYRTNPINAADEHIAASVQAVTERIASHLVDLAFAETGLGDFCLAGGVALNAKMNGALLAHPRVKRLFVPPVANDPGCAVGAAQLLYSRLTGKRPEPLRHAYYGPECGNDEIRAVLERSGLRYRPSDDVAHDTAQLLAQGNVIGWFQGRMEMGPRALGNRSILANPAEPGMKERVNDDAKHREQWRPFGPSVLESWHERYFAGCPISPFMTMALPTTPAGQRDLAAAVHVDGTCRAQTVTPDAAPLFHALIDGFGRATGVYGVLNTSLNLKGDPIVNTPREAIGLFTGTRIDNLVIGDFIVER